MCKLVPPYVTTNLSVNAFSLLKNNVSVIGSLVAGRKTTNEMLELCVKHDIYPMCEEFSFDDFPKALDRLENGRPKFRCVVKVQDSFN